MKAPLRTPFYRPILALLLLLGACQAFAADWHPAPAPLLTRWAKDVDPAHPRPEYPRPQFVRREWKSLNGLWEFAFDDRNEGGVGGWTSEHPLPLRILVPFTFEAALSGIGKGGEVHERVWYRRTFTVPSGWRGKRIHLNFNACDWLTTVWVNGSQMRQAHTGGYDPFTFDITDALEPRGAAPRGPQEIVVSAMDPADPRRGWDQPRGKQLGSHGIFYTRTTGIWQSVWLEPVDANGLDLRWTDTTVDPETREGQLEVAIGREGEAGPTALEVRVSRAGRQVAKQWLALDPLRAGEHGHTILHVPVHDCELWSPENPALYDVTFRVLRAQRTVDEVRSYCAFRRYDIRSGRLCLNGKPYFLRGVLDQGYWPDGILTAPTDAALRADVEMTKRLGFNFARKHVKIEDPRWYYWCDRLGLGVWQDMPSSHNLATRAAKENFVREWTAAIRDVRSHPSVLHWIPFNEDWGHPEEFQDRIVRLTHELDPGRPVTDASGWTQRALTDVIDAHDYGNNLIRQGVPHPVKPKVVGEFGGIALPVPGHTWTQGWGYQTARDPNGLLRRIRAQVTQLYQAPNLSGFVYTQLTDVEQELNGLMTYDRHPKTDPAAFAAIFEGRDRAEGVPSGHGGYIHHWLILGPIPSGSDLHSAENNASARAAIRRMLERANVPDEGSLVPAEGAAVRVEDRPLAWRRVRTDDDSLDFQRLFGGKVENAVVYAVAYVESPRELRDVTLLLGSDDGVKVWLNGKPVWSIDQVRGVNPDQDEVPGLTLRAGRNVLVAKVAQGVGGWGLAARFVYPQGNPIRELRESER